MAPDRIPVSVVIPAYNRPEGTVRAARSALGQVPAPAEVIVVDDRSSDDTAAAAEAAGARVVRRETNGGEGAARNSGFAAATQPWVATLDSDDAWLLGHLAGLWNALEADDTLVLASSGARVHHADGAPDEVWGCGRSEPRRLASPRDLLPFVNFLVVSGALVRRDVVLDAGGFAEGMKRCADFDLWLRVLERGPAVAIPQPSVLYSVHPGQVSDDRDAMRRAHRGVAYSYRGRPWFESTDAHRMEGALGWDELRGAARERRWGAATRAAGGFARSPRRVQGAVDVLRHRAFEREASRRLNEPARLPAGADAPR